MTVNYEIARSRILSAIEKKYDKLKDYAAKPNANKFVIDEQNAFLSQIIEFIETANEEVYAEYIKGLDIGRSSERKKLLPDRSDREGFRLSHEIKQRQQLPNLY